MSDQALLDDALESVASDDDAEDLGDAAKTKGASWIEPDTQP